MNASEERMKSTLRACLGFFKLTALTEFPKNAVQTPNPLILSCHCCYSDFCFCACTQSGCANVITKILSVNGITYAEYTCSIKEEKHGLEFEYWEFSLLLLYIYC